MKEIKFRDGTYTVPDHVAQFMEAYETYQLTYKEAMSKMNNRFLTDKLQSVQQRVINEHLARYRE